MTHKPDHPLHHVPSGDGPRRSWWSVVAEWLTRAEQRIVAGFKVPPHGG